MKTYTIKNTDIMRKGKIFPEGSTIELNDEEAKSLSEYLVIQHDSDTSLNKSKQNNKNNKRS